MSSGGVEFICGGCGSRAGGSFNRLCYAVKPDAWFIRGDDDGTQIACSRACIDLIAEKTGKTSVVLPV